MARGQLDAAVAEYQQALEIQPNEAGFHYNFGLALAGLGQLDAAMAQYRKAVELKPGHAEAHYRLGMALMGRGQLDAAVAQFEKALQYRPDYVDAHGNLGLALDRLGRADEAIAHYQQALKINPREASPYNCLAWIRATHLDPKFRDGPQAVTLARQAVALSPGDPGVLDTLAAAYAEAKRFPEAVATAGEASALPSGRASRGWPNRSRPGCGSTRRGSRIASRRSGSDKRMGGVDKAAGTTPCELLLLSRLRYVAVRLDAS